MFNIIVQTNYGVFLFILYFIDLKRYYQHNTYRKMHQNKALLENKPAGIYLEWTVEIPSEKRFVGNLWGKLYYEALLEISYEIFCRKFVRHFVGNL